MTHIQKENAYFSDFLSVPSLFFKTNYAEQFFDKDHPRDLSNLHSYFQEDFYIKNKEKIDELLKKGVVSTTMIRNFKDMPFVFHEYYKKAINSVQFPEYRYELEFDEHGAAHVKQTLWKHDMLSPPLFLDEKNSMGIFAEDEKNGIKEYGEAIIEYRSISDVGLFFMEKSELIQTVREGRFLTDPNKIGSQGLKLFDFLSRFNSFLNEINVGIAYSLIKQKTKEIKNWQ